MATKTTDKYADFRYEISFPDELREANWLIGQGDFKDMDDYLDRMTLIHKRIMKREDAGQKNSTVVKRNRLVEGKRDEAA